MWITGATAPIRQVLATHGLQTPRCHYAPSIADAEKVFADATGTATP